MSITHKEREEPIPRRPFDKARNGRLKAAKQLQKGYGVSFQRNRQKGERHLIPPQPFANKEPTKTEPLKLSFLHSHKKQSELEALSCNLKQRHFSILQHVEAYFRGQFSFHRNEFQHESSAADQEEESYIVK